MPAPRSARRLRPIVVAGTLAVTAVAATVAPFVTATASPHVATGNHCHRSRIDVPSCGVLWGQFRPKAGHGGSAHYGSVERRMGRRFDLVKDYVGWQPGGVFPGRQDARLARHGRALYISWNAVDYRDRHPVSFASIAHGRWDRSVLRPEARRLRHFHHRIFVDFNHEFDAKGHAGVGSPRQFAAAYRHIHRYLAAHRVHNVVWAWVSTGWLGNANAIRAGYPGAHYVDWIGYDPYNMAGCVGSSWTSTYDKFAPFAHWTGHQRGMRRKPLLLSEYGSVAGPSVRQWYASIPQTLQRLPRLKALIQFSGHTQRRCDVEVTHSSSALAGFVSAAKSRPVAG